MSLAQLFYLKEAVRKQCRQWRVRRRVRPSHSWRSRNTGFTMEPLEHRILLTVAPLPTPVDFEPGFVQPNTINLEANYQQQQAPANSPVSVQVDYVDTSTGTDPNVGIGLRVHYDSTKLVADAADITK